MSNLPDFDLGKTVNDFRHEVREWLRAEVPRAPFTVDQTIPPNHKSANQEFTRKLSEKGWLGLAWPKAFGGQNRSALEQLVLEEELAYAKAPTSWHFVAVNMIGPTLIELGTKEQKETWLPAILDGSASFCLGYSEPDYGSDLASLQFRAHRDGDEWVLNGQKTFNTGAGYSNFCWLAARTGSPESKHAGISMFIVPMNLQGLQITPMNAMGGHRANTLYFDNVRVPLNAMVGEENSGWKIMMKALTFERVALAGIASRARCYFDNLLEYLNSQDTPVYAVSLIQDRIGMLAADIEAARLLALNTARAIAAGLEPSVDAALLKIFSSELMQRVTETTLDILGSEPASAASRSKHELLREIEHGLLLSFMYTIGGGTNDIQRNIVAARGLGLRGQS